MHLGINHILSHNNPCFQCNKAVTNFLVSYTCEIRCNDVIVKALYLCIPTQKFLNMADLHGPMSTLGTLVFNLFHWIQLFDEKESDIR